MKQENNKEHLKYLGWLSNYQLVCGMLGIVFLLLKIGLVFDVDNGLIFFTLKLILFSFTIYAGVQYHLEDYESCILLSKISLALQTIGIYYYGFIYEYNVGLSAKIDWYPQLYTFSGRAELGVANFYIDEGDGVIISLNLVAFFLLIWVYRIRGNF